MVLLDRVVVLGCVPGAVSVSLSCDDLYGGCSLRAVAHAVPATLCVAAGPTTKASRRGRRRRRRGGADDEGVAAG